MKLFVIHLSDIHFKSSNNSLIQKKEKLIDSIKNKILQVDEVLILTSGDIAFSGKESEYEIAKGFYNDVRDSLEKYSNKTIRMFFVPGNHDCDFSQENEAIRDLAINKFLEEGFDQVNEQLIDLCCEPQNNYFDFASKYHSGLVSTHKLLNVATIKLRNFKVKLLLYNTSWFSRLHESPGTMGFPISKFKDYWDDENFNVVVSMLHHPYNWQNPNSARNFRKHIESSSDIILSGHEHEGSKKLINNLNEASTWYFESPVLQESSNPSKSGFNCIYLDFEKGLIQAETLGWQSGMFKLLDETGWKKFVRSKDLKNRKFNFQASFEEKLNDPGVTIFNRYKEKVFLNDVFVYPNLEEVDPEKDKSNFLNVTDVINSGQREFKYLILGEESSGKTSLLKTLTKAYYEQGYVPVFIKSSEIRQVDSDGILKVVKECFSSQYKEEYENYSQLDVDKKIVIIDDFHRFTKSKKSKKAFIENLNRLFKKVIVAGNQLMQYENLTADEGISSLYTDFNQLQILEYGPKLRGQLILKWNALGNEYFQNRNEYLKKIDSDTRTTDEIIGKNLVPAYPIYLLGVLQSIDTNTAQSPEYSIHGYYYQYMINQALNNSVDDSKELGFFHSFSNHYCFFLFDSKIRFSALDYDGFRTFYNNYCKEFDVDSISADKALKVLNKAKIIEIESGNIKIPYPYVYYFFVAKYMSDHIGDSDIIQTIKKMCRRVYIEEFSNITMFLVHLVKNQFILDELLSTAKTLFHAHDPVKLDGDVQLINELIDTIPTQVLEYTEVEDARAEELKNKEESEEEEELDEFLSFEDQNYDLNEDISDLDVISRLNRGVRTIEILGQLTKKNWGELKAEKKLELAEETYLLGLRIINFYYHTIETESEMVVEHIKNIIDRKGFAKGYDRDNIRKITNQFLFSVSSTGCYAIVKKVSNSIGLEELSATFKKVLEKRPYVSTELVNLSIKLDHFSGFPSTDITQFNKTNRKNYLAIHVLQRLVINYLYLYTSDYKTRNRICNELGIKVPEQLKIEFTSQIKK